MPPHSLGKPWPFPGRLKPMSPLYWPHSSSICLHSLKSNSCCYIVQKLICELSYGFSTLWPFNKACAALISALILLFGYRNPKGKTSFSSEAADLGKGYGLSQGQCNILKNYILFHVNDICWYVYVRIKNWHQNFRSDLLWSDVYSVEDEWIVYA